MQQIVRSRKEPHMLMHKSMCKKVALTHTTKLDPVEEHAMHVL